SDLNKFNSMNINHMNPNKLKSELIKVSSMKELKASYEEYINEIEPILNHDIHEKISNEINCDKLNPIVKVTLLEEYSKLSNDEIDNLNTKEFIEDIQLKQEEKMHYANERAENDQEGKEELYQNVSDRSSQVSDGLFTVLNEMERANDNYNEQSSTSKN